MNSKILIASVVVMLAVAHFFRYEVIATPQFGLGTAQLWDRWRHRLCYAVFTEGEPVCQASTEAVPPQSSGLSDIEKEVYSRARAAGFSSEEVLDFLRTHRER